MATSTQIGPGSPPFGTQSQTLRRDAYAALCGIVIVFLQKTYALEVTTIGLLIRYTLLLAIFAFFAANFQFAVAQLSSFERLSILIVMLMPIVGACVSIASSYSPSPGEILKFGFLTTLCFTLGKMLSTQDACCRALRYFYILCMIAALQAIIALSFDFLGIRQQFMIPIKVQADSRYYLGWFGLLGGDTVNFRTNFYFSESTFFAHMLMPGIAYAFVKNKNLSLVILMLGFATTSAGGAAIALVGMLGLLVLRFKVAVWAVVSAACALVFSLFAVLQNIKDLTILRKLLNRGKSIEGKFDTLAQAWNQVNQHPLGIGPVNLSATFIDTINTSSGVFQLFVAYGVMALPIFCIVGWQLLRIGLFTPRGPLSAGIAISLLAIVAGGVTHGPFFKYYCCFLFGVTLTLYRLEQQKNCI